MNPISNSRPAKALVITSAWLMLISSACGPKAPQRSPEQPVDVSSIQPRIADKDIKSEYTHVPEREFECITSAFKNHFKFGDPASPNYLTEYPSRITVKDLEEHLPSNCGGQKRGVMVHYGLKLDAMGRALPELLLAYSFICLTPAGVDANGDLQYSYDPLQYPVFQLDRFGKLQPYPQDLYNWQRLHRYAYLSNVVVERATQAGFSYLASNYDHEATIFSYEGELLHLINENGLNSTHDDKIEFHCTAEPDRRYGNLEYGFTQGIAVVAYDGTIRKLDCLNDGPGFKNRAADLGSPCPPTCNLAVFVERGLRARADCMCP